VSWTFVGNLVLMGTQWAMLVILTKLTTAEAVGKFVLAVAICAPVFFFGNMALRHVLVTDAKSEFSFGDYLGLRLLTAAGCFLVILGIAFLAPYPRETAMAIAVVGLAKAFDVVSDVFQGLFQGEERMDVAAKSMILKGLVSLGAFTFGVYLTRDLFYGTLGLAGAWALGLACYDIPMGRHLQRARRQSPAAHAPDSRVGIRPRWQFVTLGRLALVALPLGITQALLSLNNSIPRYFIDRHCGERALGLFGAIASLMMAGTTVVAALSTAACPRLASHYASGRASAFRRLLLCLLGIGLLLGVGGVAVALLGGRPLLTLLFRPEYGEHADLFVGMMIVGAILYPTFFLGTAMVSARYFRVQPLMVTGTVLVMILLSALLIPTHGFLGAVIAMGASAFVQGVVSLACIAHALHALGPKSTRSGGPA
jgi:O-antigen/teichoic acid export membrane protein